VQNCHCDPGWERLFTHSPRFCQADGSAANIQGLQNESRDSSAMNGTIRVHLCPLFVALRLKSQACAAMIFRVFLSHDFVMVALQPICAWAG
jgi:hypothetical protein